jgi:hypothetical protein
MMADWGYGGEDALAVACVAQPPSAVDDVPSKASTAKGLPCLCSTAAPGCGRRSRFRIPYINGFHSRGRLCYIGNGFCLPPRAFAFGAFLKVTLVRGG